MNRGALQHIQGFLISTVGGLLGLTLGLLGVAGVTVTTEPLRSALVLGAVLLGIISIAACIAGVAKFMKLRVADPLATPGVVVGSHVTRWAEGPSDVNEAAAFFCRLLPEETSISLTTMQYLREYNPKTVFLVEKDTDGTRSLVGMGVVAPVTAAARDDVLAKRLATIADVDLENHVSRDWRNPPAVYIGGAAGDPADPIATVRVLDFLATWIAMSETPYCFAHPVSPKGRRLMERLGFHPIGDGTPMWMIRGRRLIHYRTSYPEKDEPRP